MLVASELYDAADAPRTVSSRTRTRGGDITDHSSDLTSQGFNGTAADAGKALLRGFGHSLFGPSVKLDEVAEILWQAAMSQENIERMIETALKTPLLLGTELYLTKLLAELRLYSLILDFGCSESINATCMADYEPDIERLAHNLDKTPQQIHDELYAKAPDHVKQIVDETGAMLLEGGPGGYTVMVGPSGQGVPTNPASISILSPGVGSGDPNKLAGLVSQAQDVADHNTLRNGEGQAAVMWLGYSRSSPRSGTRTARWASRSRTRADSSSAGSGRASSGGSHGQCRTACSHRTPRAPGRCGTGSPTHGLPE